MPIHPRFLDPKAGSGDSILVAKFDGSRRDRETVRDLDHEAEMRANDKRERELRSLMGQRHSFAG